jgi:REP element-mobilizing transposase RayT
MSVMDHKRHIRVAESPGSTPVTGVGESVSLSHASDSHLDQSRGVEYYQRRLPHFEKPWAIYALSLTTRERRKLPPTARAIVLDSMLHFHRQRYELFAVCVMPDHVHALLQPWPKRRIDDNNIEFWSIAKLAHSWKSFTAHEINRIEGWTGPLWEEETFDRFIRTERDLWEKFEYIRRNPYEARLVSPGDNYPWLWTSEDGLQSRDVAKVRFGETPKPTPETGVLPDVEPLRSGALRENVERPN